MNNEEKILSMLKAMDQQMQTLKESIDFQFCAVKGRLDHIDVRLDHIEEVLTEVKGTGEYLAEWADMAGPAIGIPLASVAAVTEENDAE